MAPNVPSVSNAYNFILVRDTWKKLVIIIHVVWYIKLMYYILTKPGVTFKWVKILNTQSNVFWIQQVKQPHDLFGRQRLLHLKQSQQQPQRCNFLNPLVSHPSPPLSSAISTTPLSRTPLSTTPPSSTPPSTTEIKLANATARIMIKVVLVMFMVLIIILV